MASVVAVKSNTGSTIAIIVTLLGLAVAGYFIATRALKDFKFPEFPSFPEIRFPEFSDIFGPSIRDVENLPLTPLGEGIGIEQLKQAFRVEFPSGSSIARSVGRRDILSPGQFGVTGRRLPPRAVAFRIPTFVGTITTRARGTRLIAGSEGLFARLLDNLRRSSNAFVSRSTPTRPDFSGLGRREAARRSTIFNARFGIFKAPRVSRSGACISNCPGGFAGFGRIIAPSTAAARRRRFRR